MIPKIKIKVDGNAKQLIKSVRTNRQVAMQDIVDSWLYTSSNTAPIDKGILRKSFTNGVVEKGTASVGWLEASVNEPNNKNNFNYALWIHEGNYNLGENSKKANASGGGEGMSGKSYSVGNKYIERVLHGELETYKKHIKDTIENGI